MADEADFFGVNLFAGFQGIDSGLSVARKVFGGSLVVIASGLANSALVVAKNGNAFAREIIGQHEKWAMPGDIFVAVMRSRASDENSGRKRTGARRKRKRARERNLRFRTRKGHFFFAVRVRLSRILRAHQFEQLIRALKIQVASDAALRPGPRNDRFRGI